MNQHLTDSELWSGLDRNAIEVAEHVASCAMCRDRAESIRAGISAVTEAAIPIEPILPETIGPYKILRRLGQGGMGIVYEAEQEATRRLVALKVIRGGIHVDDYRLRLFEREAQTLARLRHPAIAAVYEGGRTTQGEHFFAMEHVRGAPLTEYVRVHDVPREARLRLFHQVCLAINHAHQRGVIHRDLKPSNIFVDDDGQPKVLDFGLARIVDPDGSPATMTIEVGRIMGTLPYMSPEEVRGDGGTTDVRSDVYSLGVILHELLTDQLPYVVRRGALPEAIRVICEEIPRRAGSIDPTLRGDLEAIVAKALEKDVNRRYQSAATLAEDVDRYLRNLPVVARRSTFVYRSRKWMARHRWTYLIGLVIIASIAVASLALTSIAQFQRSGVELTLMLKDLEAATKEHRLADVYHELGRDAEAEPFFRSAIQTFVRLGRDERAAPGQVALASILMQRPNQSEKDLDEAESFLLDAAHTFEQQRDGSRERLREALLLLQRLYSNIDVYSDEARQRIEERIRILDDPELDRRTGMIEPSPKLRDRFVNFEIVEGLLITNGTENRVARIG